MESEPGDDGDSSIDADDSLLERIARIPEVAPPVVKRAGGLGPGDVVAQRYELLELAGKGGMGAVFQAHDRQAGAAVALKVLQRTSDAYASRFRREASVLAMLGHDAIVRYVDHGESEGGALYLVMDWLAGETLAQRLQRGPLSVADTIEVVATVSSALGMAHAQGVVHRDIKPSNVFLREGSISNATVLDFGLALLQDANEQLTRSGAMPGTPAYMAPEQVRGERDLDARADVFALGCVAFECLAGRHPFAPVRGAPLDPARPALGALAISARILLEEPPRLADVVSSIPPGLDALVARMLGKSRDARPPDGAAVARELAGLG